MQLRVRDSTGEEVAGIVRQDPAAPPRALIMRTERSVVHRKPILNPDEHLFTDQAAQIYDTRCRASAINLGQTNGNKYKAKAKKMQVYTNEEIDAAIQSCNEKAKSKQPKSALDRLGSCDLEAQSNQDGASLHDGDE